MTNADTPRTEKLYRFELAFEGEPQGVGLFNGIYEAVPDPDLADRLQDRFTALPVPHVTRECKFWFTGIGLAASLRPLLDVMRVIGEHGWSLAVAVIDRPEAGPAYENPFQIAYAPEDISPLGPQYDNIDPDGLAALVQRIKSDRKD